MSVSFRRPTRFRGAALLVLLGAFGAACQYGVTSPTTPATPTSGGSASPVTTLTYVHDIQPLFASDCTRCHGPSRRDANVDLSTYAGVMKVVVAGNPSSILVQVTQSGGLMYSQWTGNRNPKAALVYDWVVSSGAKQQ
jgi:hypothetical protein